MMIFFQLAYLRRGTVLLCSCIFIVQLISCTSDLGSAKSGDIALYTDRGTWPESITAAERMFLWMDYSVERVDAGYINKYGLETFRLLCIPGGDMYRYGQDLSPQGKEKIRRFIREGGGYIGICGGAYFASSEVWWQGSALPMDPLDLYVGRAEGPIAAIGPYPGYDMCQVHNTGADHPIMASEPRSSWILYYWGPILLPQDPTTVSILGTYDLVNQPAILAFSYSQGRVFLIGTHPEIEEDSNRDGVEFADELNDQGTDWELMKKATAWCLAEL